MVGYCLLCGAPLPSTATARRKFCNVECRKKWHRLQKNPSIRERHRVPPASQVDDPEIQKILDLPYEPTLRRELLKDHLKKRDERVRQNVLKEVERLKEETVLDPDTRRKVARFLAKERYA